MSRHPTQSILRELLTYDAMTGLLFWRPRTPEHFLESGPRASTSCNLFNGQYAGKEAFTATSKAGYRVGAIYRRNYLAHRVIWTMVVGEWPEGNIDHINGNRCDNRFSNLRDVSFAENHRNMKRPKNNTSGQIGVHWSSGNNGWVAQLTHDGRVHCLGTYAELHQAIAARKEAERNFGFHPNHGRPT